MDRTMPGALRVGIADPDAGTRARLRDLLGRSRWPPAQVVLECESAAALLERAVDLPLDAIFADIVMPGDWRLAGPERWGVLRPDLVFMTSQNDHAMRAFELEAIDCLTRPIPEGRLIKTLQRLWRRRRSAGAFGGSQPSDGPIALTTRQQQILTLLSEHLTNKQIARILGLSHFTVRNHVVELFRLFGVSRRGDLVKAAEPLTLDAAGRTRRQPPQILPSFGLRAAQETEIVRCRA